MLTLTVESGEGAGRRLCLERGVYVLGRAADGAAVLEDPTVSGQHCEIRVTDLGVTVRDLGSSNGTWVDQHPVSGETELRDGQELRLGELRLRASIPPVHIAIPELTPPEDDRVAFTPEGLPACLNHRDQPADYFCPHCRRTFCATCIHALRVAGGPLRLMCPACSHLCEPLAARAAGAGAETWRVRVTRALRRAFDFRRPPRSGG